jgi:transposase InsO family protein
MTAVEPLGPLFVLARVLAGSLTREYLAREAALLKTRAEATIVIEQWRRHDNDVRPHSSVGHLPPQEFKTQNERQH